MHNSESLWSAAAAWVEAIGAIAAVIGSGWVAASESRATRGREDRAAAAAIVREERTALATRTAALNLAIMAASEIHDLHVFLRDAAWQGRVARVSASLALRATEKMLTAFPIQSLGNAPAMVAFSRFPASLAIVAEVYGNLETAVRAAAVVDRAALFDACDQQMARLDVSAQTQLTVLRRALDLDAVAPSAVAV